MGREELLKNVPMFAELGKKDLERLLRASASWDQAGRTAAHAAGQ